MRPSSASSSSPNGDEMSGGSGVCGCGDSSSRLGNGTNAIRNASGRRSGWGPWRPESIGLRLRLRLAGGGSFSLCSFCSSSLISCSRVFWRSLEAFLNSFRLRPSDLPSSGSLRGPKMMSAITKMMISSGMPMEPNMGVLQMRVQTAGPPASASKNEYTPPLRGEFLAGWGVIG